MQRTGCGACAGGMLSPPTALNALLPPTACSLCVGGRCLPAPHLQLLPLPPPLRGPGQALCVPGQHVQLYGCGWVGVGWGEGGHGGSACCGLMPWHCLASLQSSSIDFLARCGFDFNKTFYDGIGYTTGKALPAVAREGWHTANAICTTADSSIANHLRSLPSPVAPLPASPHPPLPCCLQSRGATPRWQRWTSHSGSGRACWCASPRTWHSCRHWWRKSPRGCRYGQGTLGSGWAAGRHH